MQYSMKKLTIALVALCMVAVPGHAVFAASDDAITTRAEAQTYIAPLIPALSGAVSSLSVSMSADRAALAQIRGQLATLLTTLATLQTHLSAGTDVSTAQGIVSNASTQVSLMSEATNQIHARQQTEVSILSSMSKTLSSIFSMYLSLPA